MDTKNAYPSTLLEAIRYFANPLVCHEFMVAMRWPDGVVSCPTCARDDPRWLENARVWECRNRHPRKKFSVKKGTIFEDSPIGLDKWLPAVWMIANDKNGISSYEMHRALGVTQKSAWFMLHRIRLAMQDGTFTKKLSGQVEADETFIGGKAGSYAALGSVEGKLERINLRGRAYFTIWDRVSRAPVKCHFPRQEQWIDKVRELLDKRVLAKGRVHYFRNGIPRSVDAQDVFDRTPDPTLPRASFGSIPDITGGLSTAEYLRRLRERTSAGVISLP